jgi:hypothetical protein
MKYIKEMLGNGDTSVKRVIAFLGFLFLAIPMLYNSTPSTDLFDAVKIIVLVCIGGNVAEKWAVKEKTIEQKEA